MSFSWKNCNLTFSNKGTPLSSTCHAIAQLLDQITEAFDHEFLTLGVLIHLKKVFDTVSHEIL